MDWYCPLFAHAGWQEFARVFPREAQHYRNFPGLCKHLRPMVWDFMLAYEGR